MGQVEYGYLIVFYPADKRSAAGKVAQIARSYQSLWGGRNIKVCFCPCNDSALKPIWVPYPFAPQPDD